MNKRYLQVAAIIILLGLGFFIFKGRVKPQVSVTDFNSCTEATGSITNQTSPRVCSYDGHAYTEILAEPDVIVDSPLRSQVIISPLIIKGRAQNTWYFEANLPVTLKDANGKVLVQKGLHAMTDWTVSGYVDFSDSLTFTTPSTQDGVLIIEKDNPSGDPKNDKSFVVPVKFY